MHALSCSVLFPYTTLFRSLTLLFTLISTGSQLSVTTDANGHYNAVANAGVYYLQRISGNAPQPVGSINVNKNVTAHVRTPDNDVNRILSHDFQLTTTTLNV